MEETNQEEKKKTEISVCLKKGGAPEQAESFAKKVNAIVDEKPGEGLTVLFDGNGVSLLGYGLSYRGDFEQMLHRVTEGRLLHEMLIHAAKNIETGGIAIDATAGMGEDSLLLAAYGFEVTLFEQNPVVAVLLKDAIRRAKKHPILKEIVCRMHPVEGDSIAAMKKMVDPVDLIYLDPMFPGREKSGLIHKKMQLIQKLESPCAEEEDLFFAAKSLNPKRIIVKRPQKAPNLAGQKPNYSIPGKAIRYDCYSAGKSE